MLQVFGHDLTLCLMMSSFHQDPILSEAGHNARVSVYSDGDKQGTRRVASMKLRRCEGEVVGQTFSAVRGYVWRDKVG